MYSPAVAAGWSLGGCSRTATWRRFGASPRRRESSSTGSAPRRTYRRSPTTNDRKGNRRTGHLALGRFDLALGHGQFDPSRLDIVDGVARNLDLAAEQAPLLDAERGRIGRDDRAELLAVGRPDAPACLDHFPVKVGRHRAPPIGPSPRRTS